MNNQEPIKNFEQNISSKDTLNDELEIVEFSINESLYGIKVIDIHEIIRKPDQFVSVPDAHKSIEGVINLRGDIIPIVNLARHLNARAEYQKDKSRIIVAEYNESLSGFLINQVNGIHHVMTTNIEKSPDMGQSQGGYAIFIIILS